MSGDPPALREREEEDFDEEFLDVVAEDALPKCGGFEVEDMVDNRGSCK